MSKSKLEEFQERVDFLEKQIKRYQKEDQKRFEAAVEAYVSAQARFLQAKARADNLDAQAKERSKKIPRWYNINRTRPKAECADSRRAGTKSADTGNTTKCWQKADSGTSQAAERKVLSF